MSTIGVTLTYRDAAAIMGALEHRAHALRTEDDVNTDAYRTRLADELDGIRYSISDQVARAQA